MPGISNNSSTGGPSDPSASPAAVGAGVGVPLGALALSALAWGLWERRKRKREVAALLSRRHTYAHYASGSLAGDLKPGEAAAFMRPNGTGTTYEGSSATASTPGGYAPPPSQPPPPTATATTTHYSPQVQAQVPATVQMPVPRPVQAQNSTPIELGQYDRAQELA